MNAQTAHWIHKSRTNLESVRAKFAHVRSMTRQSYKDFRLAHEMAIKAVIIEKGGSLPDTDKLTNICQLIGLWSVVPPKFQDYLCEVDVCGSDISDSDEPQNRHPAWSSVEGWRSRLEMAPKFVFFIENQVIGNPSLLKGISVP